MAESPRSLTGRLEASTSNLRIPGSGTVGPGDHRQDGRVIQCHDWFAQILVQHDHVPCRNFLNHVLRVDSEPAFQDLQSGAACDRVCIDRGTGSQRNKRYPKISGLGERLCCTSAVVCARSCLRL